METRTRSRQADSLPVGADRTLLWPEAETPYLFGLPWPSAAVFLLALLTLISTSAQLSRPDFYNKTQVLYAHYYRTVQVELPTVEVDALTPWPDFTRGKLGWYRQGLVEVEANAAIIHATGDEQVPPIVLAAAIANQGGSAQRPFGIDAFERIQLWLGTTFDWPFPAWGWANQQWTEIFERPSIGIAQLLPSEAARLQGMDAPDLFDDATSVRLMHAKLKRVAQTADALGLNQTQRFVLLALANNYGAGTLDGYFDYDKDLESYLGEHPQSRIQLAKMMSFVDYLAYTGAWTVPDGLNREYIWWLVNQPAGAP